MTTTKPLPPHGSHPRYRGNADRPPCRCTICRQGESRRAKQRRYLHAIGQPGLIPVEPVALHLEILRAGGASLVAVAEAAHCTPDMLSRILGNQFERIHRDLASRITAVTLTQAIDYRRPVPILGSARRLQALYAVGHGLKEIVDHTGLTRQFLAGVVSQAKPTISLGSADLINACWHALKDTEGGCTRNRNRAAREGWLRPDQWVDDDIDCLEEEAAPGQAAPQELSRAACIAICRDLTLEGCTAEEIAARIGRSTRTVWRWQAQHDWKAAA